jgi:hypothetical protein
MAALCRARGSLPLSLGTTNAHLHSCAYACELCSITTRSHCLDVEAPEIGDEHVGERDAAEHLQRRAAVRTTRIDDDTRARTRTCPVRTWPHHDAAPAW